MPKVTRTSVFINADRDHVFSYVKDLNRMAEWRGDGIKVEKVTPGIVGIGSKFKVEGDGAGKKGHAEITISDYEFPLRFAYSVTDEKGSYEHLIDFHMKDSGTVFDQSVTSKAPMFSGLFGKKGVGSPPTKAALQTLKAKLEQPVSTESAKAL